MMKKILVLCCFFWSFFAYAMTDEEFIEREGKWFEAFDRSISQHNFFYTEYRGCKLLSMNEPTSNKAHDFDLLYDTMDFWYDCTNSKEFKIVRKCNSEAPHYRTIKDTKKKNEWEKAFASCLKANDLIMEFKGYIKVLDENTNIEQCRTGYKWNLNTDERIPKVYCRYR